MSDEAGLRGPKARFDEFPDWDEIDWTCAEFGRLAVNSPGECLERLPEFTDTLNDDRLCQVGVNVLEALIDLHWADLGDQLYAAFNTHASLRKALSCTWLSIDEEGEERLKALIRPGEEIGRRKATSPREPRWEATRRAPIRTIRLPQLLASLAKADSVGLQNGVNRAEIERLADPGAGHLLWPRFHRDTPVPFYRCGLMLFCPHQRFNQVVAEVDLPVADVEALPKTEATRIAALLRTEIEKLPGIEEI